MRRSTLSQTDWVATAQLRESLRGAVELLRPAVAVTAAADVLAGVAVAGHVYPDILARPWYLLVMAGCLLYAGIAAFNDYCDTEQDRRLQAQRPISAGRVSPGFALTLGLVLLAGGVLMAFSYRHHTGVLAGAIAALAISYGGFGKRRPLWGPVNLGLCRAGSLLLGVAASNVAIDLWWFLGAFPLTCAIAIGLVGRAQTGGLNPYGHAALILVIGVVGTLLWFVFPGALHALPFVALFGFGVTPGFYHAARRPTPLAVRRAVRGGMLSLILFDAALAATFAGLVSGAAVLALFPLSRLLARRFPVD